MNEPNVSSMNSQGWNFFVKACFVLSVAAMVIGIWQMPVDNWVRGYLGMGSLMLVTSSIMMSKTVRDEFEARKLVNRISEARTERMLKEVDVA